eukprot:2262062-Pyramimonas_sp.AAC.1
MPRYAMVFRSGTCLAIRYAISSIANDLSAWKALLGRASDADGSCCHKRPLYRIGHSASRR